MTLYKSETLWDAPINGTPSEFAAIAKKIEPRFVVTGARLPPSGNAHPLWTGGALRTNANPVNLYLYAPGERDIILSIKVYKIPNGNKSGLEVYHLLWDGEPDYPEAIEVWQRLRAEMERLGFIEVVGAAPNKHFRASQDAQDQFTREQRQQEDARRKRVVAQAEKIKLENAQTKWRDVARDVGVPERTLRDWRHNPKYQ